VRPQEYAKAIIGGVLAGLGVVGTALTDGVVSAAEWVDVAVATLTVFAGVFGLPNAPKKETVAQTTVTTETKTVDVAPPTTSEVIGGDVELPDLSTKDVTGL
jgi:hypothetical protein